MPTQHNDPTEQQHDISTNRLLRDDTKFASGKIAVFQYFTVAIFAFLLFRFWNLQIRDTEYFSERAEKNRFRSLPISAPRGKILDRDGRVIVDNHSSFRAVLSRENLKEEHLQAIAEGLHLDLDELRAKLRRFQSRAKYEDVVIKQELTPGELAFVESHRDTDTFPELAFIHSQARLYPRNGLAAHVIGYVGEVSETELGLPDFARYSQGDVIGKYGIERQYNDILMGIDGQRRVEVDSRGRERTLKETKEAVPGKSLQLTLDLDLQAVAELALENRRGAVVALDPRNGEVLAMVSRPAYDPNVFAGHIRNQDWKAITDNPFYPLTNRAIQAQLAPGSTFKPLMALAGLESGVIDNSFTAHCGGGANYYGRYFKCHAKSGHGVVDVHKGIVQSCDVFFYSVGNHLGIDRIAQYAEMVGLGHKTGIDLPHEAAGVVPSSKWKLQNQRQKWYAGETISVSIGQGALTVTPLQLANYVAGLANGGVWYRPHLVRDESKPEPPRRASLEPENVAKVISGMYGVVNEGGTGWRARLPGIEVCGKTGTAQLASNELLKKMAKIGETLKDNAWFVGFAPRQNPEIVVVALFENGVEGPYAAPIVRDVMKAYFDKKQRGNARQLASSMPALAFTKPAPPPREQN